MKNLLDWLYFSYFSALSGYVHWRVTVASIDSVHPDDLEAAKNTNPAIFLRSSESRSFQYPF